MAISSASVQVLPVETVAGSPGAGAYHGYHLRFTGVAGVVNIRDGDVSGTIIDQVNGTTSLEHSEWQYGEDGRGGVLVKEGLFVEVVSGTVVGSVKFSTA